MRLLIVIFFLLWSSLAFSAPEITVSYALALHNKPKYKEGFKHFDYVNPDAPKGGTFNYYAIGTYDTFNPYGGSGKGTAAYGISMVWDSLMRGPADELKVRYGLIAEKVEYPDDFSWIIFHLRHEARFVDGKPILADDVVFSFNLFKEKGIPNVRKRYKEKVKDVVALDKHRVKFIFNVKGEGEIMYSVAGLPIMAPHFWKNHDFAEPTAIPPLGSGPYRVKEFKLGQYIIYERIKDYWAEDLPVNKGLGKFVLERYDYYKDSNVALEAFKAGEYDLRSEASPKNWATMYKGPNFDNKFILKQEIPHQIPQGIKGLVFNTQRPPFNDRLVRKALSYALDFEWMNKNLFYDQYTRNKSFFTNSEFASKGAPGKQELKILETLRGKVPEEVFTREYQPPQTDGSGNIRQQIRTAHRILKKAGWEIKDRKLTNVNTGKPFEFELLIYFSPLIERKVVPFQKNLEKMGITMRIKAVDNSRINQRLRVKDFDMIYNGFSAIGWPSSLFFKQLWHSDNVDKMWNQASIANPAIDILIEEIQKNQFNHEKMFIILFPMAT